MFTQRGWAGMLTRHRPKTRLSDRMIDFETGALSDSEVLDLFSELISTGICWHLRGRYAHYAVALIDHGWISETGEVLD